MPFPTTHGEKWQGNLLNNLRVFAQIQRLENKRSCYWDYLNG